MTTSSVAYFLLYIVFEVFASITCGECLSSGLGLGPSLVHQKTFCQSQICHHRVFFALCCLLAATTSCKLKWTDLTWLWCSLIFLWYVLHQCARLFSCSATCDWSCHLRGARCLAVKVWYHFKAGFHFSIVVASLIIRVVLCSMLAIGPYWPHFFKFNGCYFALVSCASDVYPLFW